jgi:hypothetical protein
MISACDRYTCLPFCVFVHPFGGHNGCRSLSCPGSSGLVVLHLDRGSRQWYRGLVAHFNFYPPRRCLGCLDKKGLWNVAGSRATKNFLSSVSLGLSLGMEGSTELLTVFVCNLKYQYTPSFSGLL